MAAKTGAAIAASRVTRAGTEVLKGRGGPHSDTVEGRMIKTVLDAQEDLASVDRGKQAIEVVPYTVARVDPLISMAAAPDSERAASFRVLRHRVVQQGNPRVILVSSPRRGQGKT